MTSLKYRHIDKDRTIGSIEKYIEEVINIIGCLPLSQVTRAIEVLEEARCRGRNVYTFGNGGSAATASHFACDLAKGAIGKNRQRIKALALTDNIPLISAWANDTSYENVFAEQLENLVSPGDIVIGISGSGNSTNILNGIKTAKDMGATTIGFTGFDGGQLADIVDVAIIVPGYSMEQVEDIHLLIEHVITTCLRDVV